MTDTESERFHSLPALLSDDVEQMRPGKVLRLQLLEYLPAGGWAMFPVRYVHRELIYRTDGRKDAVAFGTAEIAGGEACEVRILFSRPHSTAAMKGAVLEGSVRRANG